ncbi:NAD(P)/FAD-dependent oxidoreductase [Aminirod propionatiphilus]|uniref:NAD(P)/FAD-dependent oxidoreductase n=1 Tax=Aminirod propionatiphilus TaxID=3415223 RepID=UPI003BFA7439
MERVVLLGGGPAGITAAKLLRRKRPDWEVTMIRPERASMIYCAIPYVIEGLFGQEKVCKSDALVTDTGARLVIDEATRVDFTSREIHTGRNGLFPFDRLLIATGARPVLPPIQGLDGARNVFPVKTEEDLSAILGAMTERSRQAVVVGAGNIGIEMAQAFARRGLKTTLIEMAPHILPALVDADMASPLEDRLRALGVDVRTGLGLCAVEQDGERVVKGLLLSNGDRLGLNEGGRDDLIVVSAGVRPNVELFEGTRLHIGRTGIVVDSAMATNITGVWAAGDCCEYRSFIDGEIAGGKLATNAVPMAKVAARNMVGEEWHYQGFLNGAATVVEKLRVGGTGFTEELCLRKGIDVVVGHGETTSRFPMMPEATKVRVKLIFRDDDGRLLGGQAFGGEAVAERIDLLTLAIKSSATIEDLMNFDYSSQPWQTFFPAANAIVMAAEEAWARKADRSRAERCPE